ncbi:MAG: hypothetical protein WC845_00575 [Candidatus Staskawiczbacteria bacterium]|jgi:3D (Asp-Asp-Asp) domain-containing protein
MENITKTTIFRAKNTIIKVMTLGVVIACIFEILTPKTSEADFLLDNYSFLGNLAITQDNTLLSKSNSIESAQVEKKVKMVITAYSSTVEQTDSTPFVTASGSTVRDGVVANNMLPFGTKIRIPELYEDKVFVVEDRMNTRKGDYHLDLWFASTEEAKNFGAETSYIEVLGN